MHDLQVARIIAKYPAKFSQAQAIQVVARAYGYRKLEVATNAMSGRISGLQPIKPYSEMLRLDPVHQTMELMRMALNLLANAGDDVRLGVSERELVATMCGFSSFDSLMAYAKDDPVDPNTTDEKMLEKYRVRYGIESSVKYLLGRGMSTHTLIIQPNPDLAQRFVDQEITLNPLDGICVAVVRDNPSGAHWLKLMQPNLELVTGPVDGQYKQAVFDSAGKSNVIVGIVPSRAYDLVEIVEAHADALMRDSKDGRALIVDLSQLNLSSESLEPAFERAAVSGIQLVVILSHPNSELWNLTATRLIFGFDPEISESNLEMDTYLTYASPYIGFKRGKMQYLYQSELSGPRFAAADLIPDEVSTLSLLERMKDAIRG